SIIVKLSPPRRQRDDDEQREGREGQDASHDVPPHRRALYMSSNFACPRNGATSKVHSEAASRFRAKYTYHGIRALNVASGRDALRHQSAGEGHHPATG